MTGRHYSASHLIHGFVAAAVVGAVAIIALTALLVSDDRDLWLNLASEAAGVLLGGSVVAYLFERILRREEQARREHETAGVSLAASLMVNQSIGRIAILVATYLTRALDLRAPTPETPLRDALTSLADQLTDKLRRPLDEIWDPDGDGAPTNVLARLDHLHEDQMRVARPLVTGIVRAHDQLRTSVVPLLQTVNDVELLTALSAADAHGSALDDLLDDWATEPIVHGPAVAFKWLPDLLKAAAEALGVIEARTDVQFLYERPPVRAQAAG
jgi:hypothetical protein